MKCNGMRMLGIVVLGGVLTTNSNAGVVGGQGGGGGGVHPAASNPHPAAPSGGIGNGTSANSSPGNWSPPSVWGNVLPTRREPISSGLSTFPPGGSLGPVIPSAIPPSGFDTPTVETGDPSTVFQPPHQSFGGFNSRHHGPGPGPGTIQGFNNNPVQGFNPEPVTGFTPEPVTGFISEPVTGLTPEPVTGLNPNPVTGFTPQPVNGFHGGINTRQGPIKNNRNFNNRNRNFDNRNFNNRNFQQQRWNRRGNPIFQGPGDSPFPSGSPPLGSVIDVPGEPCIVGIKPDRPLSSVDFSATIIEWAGVRVVRGIPLGSHDTRD